MAVKYEFKKLFARKELYVVITLLVVFTCLDFIDKSLSFVNQSYTNIHSAWQLWIGFGSGAGFFRGTIGNVLSILIPMLVTVSYSDSYTIEKQAGLSVLALTRENRNSYFMAKLWVSFLTGFVIACIPYILNLCLCLAIFPHSSSAHVSNWPTSSNVLTFEAKYLLFPEIDLNNPGLSSIIRIFLMGIYGGTCSLLGVAVSFFSKKRITVSAGVTIFAIVLSFIGAVVGYPMLIPIYYLFVHNSVLSLSINYFIGFIALLIGITFVLSVCKLLYKKDEIA